MQVSDESTDRDLVVRICARDEQAFEALFERYGAPIHRHLARYVRHAAAAQDLVQEVFLRVWTRAEQWDGRGSFKGWLYRIATNLALNHLRSVRRRREQPLPAVDEEWGDEGEERFPAWIMDDAALEPDVAVERSEQSARIALLVADLPQEKQEVWHLVHEMEMSIRDAADELGIPPGTVKSRLFYAKRRLAREWQDLETT
jgi:RNA polymerase sigma-70 factor (ECF subfamily)